MGIVFQQLGSRNLGTFKKITSQYAGLFRAIPRRHVHLNPEVRGQKPDGIRLGYSFLISDL